MSVNTDYFVSIRSTKTKEITAFLHEADQRLISRMFDPSDVQFDGGYKGASRKRAYFHQSVQHDIRRLRINADTRYHSLTHQVILGSLLGSGIPYDQIGDILPKQQIIIVTKTVVKQIKYTITHIGNTPVSFELVSGDGIVAEQEYEEMEAIVDSMRLDQLVKAIAHVSRKDAKTMIEKELVKRNHEVDSKPTRIIQEDDVLSIRHHGRFIIDDINGRTRKDKIIVKYRKFV